MPNKRIIAFLLVVCMMAVLMSGCVRIKIEEENGVKKGEEIIGKNEESEKEAESLIPEKDEAEINRLRAELDESAVVKAELAEACGFEDFDKRTSIREEYPLDEEFSDAVIEFSRVTTSAIDNDSENLIYSPLSLYYALSILAYGTSGDAEAELTALLGCEKDELPANAEALYRQIYDDNEMGKTQISNSLWVDRNKGITFKDEWINKTSKSFFASVYDVDFNDRDTGDIIGQWISDTTGGQLEYSFNPDPAQVMNIINSVNFSDQWTDWFDESLTEKDEFTNRDGSKTECDFMNKEEMGSFYKTDDYQMCSLSLKNGGSVTFILPAGDVDPQTLLYDEGVYGRIFDWLEYDESRGNGIVTWKIPKFSYQGDLNLVDALRKLGVNSVFDTDDSMPDISDDPLFVSSVIQKAKVSVSEKGIEAAAYTEISYCGSAMPTDTCEMILDRPFAFIVTARNNIPIFVGVVNELN